MVTVRTPNTATFSVEEIKSMMRLFNRVVDTRGNADLTVFHRQHKKFKGMLHAKLDALGKPKYNPDGLSFEELVADEQDDSGISLEYLSSGSQSPGKANPLTNTASKVSKGSLSPSEEGGREGSPEPGPVIRVDITTRPVKHPRGDMAGPVFGKPSKPKETFFIPLTKSELEEAEHAAALEESEFIEAPEPEAAAPLTQPKRKEPERKAVPKSPDFFTQQLNKAPKLKIKTKTVTKKVSKVADEQVFRASVAPMVSTPVHPTKAKKVGAPKVDVEAPVRASKVTEVETSKVDGNFSAAPHMETIYHDNTTTTTDGGDSTEAGSEVDDGEQLVEPAVRSVPKSKTTAIPKSKTAAPKPKAKRTSDQAHLDASLTNDDTEHIPKRAKSTKSSAPRTVKTVKKSASPVLDSPQANSPAARSTKKTTGSKAKRQLDLPKGYAMPKGRNLRKGEIIALEARAKDERRLAGLAKRLSQEKESGDEEVVKDSEKEITNDGNTNGDVSTGTDATDDGDDLEKDMMEMLEADEEGTDDKQVDDNKDAGDDLTKLVTAETTEDVASKGSSGDDKKVGDENVGEDLTKLVNENIVEEIVSKDTTTDGKTIDDSTTTGDKTAVETTIDSAEPELVFAEDDEDFDLFNEASSAPASPSSPSTKRKRDDDDVVGDESDRVSKKEKL